MEGLQPSYGDPGHNLTRRPSVGSHSQAWISKMMFLEIL